MVGDSEVRLWGLRSQERLRRLLSRAGVSHLISEGEPTAAGEVVCFRADYLFEERTVADLVARSDAILEVRENGRRVPVAAHVSSERLHEALGILRGKSGPDEAAGLERATPETLSVGYTEKLRKFEPPIVTRIDAGRHAELERHLFDGSYKGVTDAVTKWVWPVPARWVTGLCARAGIRPNQVTLASLLLVILVTFLFAQGYRVSGLALAWIMTFLDTVDGKLARVTVQSSHLGHIFDHGIDLIHPPVWYLAWGVGLASFGVIPGLSVAGAFWLILSGYVVGRLVEGAFKALFGRFSIFCWRPLDSYFRLVVARRNPNLVLLTACTMAGRPDWGFAAVTIWTVASAVFLLVRLGMAAYERLSGPLQSWLEELQHRGGALPLAWPFVRRAVDRGLDS